ncbi:unnamed protein product [Effrenium voratum]|nr:unnamed protein product [Effrenium voratum]
MAATSSMRVMRAVLMACIIFLLAHQCSVRLTSTFLGPQRDQGKRSKPAAGALPTSPEKRPTEVMDEQNQSWKAVENAVWNVISLAFWVVFFRAIVVEDVDSRVTRFRWRLRRPFPSQRSRPLMAWALLLALPHASGLLRGNPVLPIEPFGHEVTPAGPLFQVLELKKMTLSQGDCLCQQGEFWHRGRKACVRQFGVGNDCTDVAEYAMVCKDGLVCKSRVGSNPSCLECEGMRHGGSVPQGGLGERVGAWAGYCAQEFKLEGEDVSSCCLIVHAAEGHCLRHRLEHSVCQVHEGRGKVEKPKKGDYRQRAHCNPLCDWGDTYPASPDHVDWSVHFPSFFPGDGVNHLQLNTSENPIQYPESAVRPECSGKAGPHQVRFLDVGCGFGGLLMALSPKFPDKLMLGLEIREQVTNYVGKRIEAMRQGAEGAPSHHNVSVIRTNAMKFLPNYFRKGQLEKMFFCFPDPHFKRKNARRRIISYGLLSVYAYLMCPGGLLYHATDVKELHEWMDQACEEHPLFVRVPEEEIRGDPCIEAVVAETEEAKRVKNLGRFGHEVHLSVFRRVDPFSSDAA